MVDVADIVGKFTSILAKNGSRVFGELAHPRQVPFFLSSQSDSRGVAVAVTGGTSPGPSCSLDDLPQHFI